MKTPYIFKRQFENHVVTGKMLGACIYSCEKRVIFHKDKMRSYKVAHKRSKAEEQEMIIDSLEAMEELFLSLLRPICIHVEEVEIKYDGSWFSHTDYVQNYYFYYEVGGYCFHQPITADQINGTLGIEEIDPLIPTRPSISSLLSIQFCCDVYGLIVSGQYTYVPFL